MRIRTIALALPLVVGGAACSTTSSQRTQAAAPPPVAATEREGNAPANRPESQPGSGVGATAPGQPMGTAASGSDVAAADDLKAHSDDDVISGTISKVSGHSLTISSDDGNQHTLQLVPQTSVMVNGQEAQTTDLQEGQPVRASFSSVEDRDVAVDVRAGSASGTGQSASPSDASGFQGTPGAGGMPGPGGGGPQSSDQPTPSRLPKRN